MQPPIDPTVQTEMTPEQLQEIEFQKRKKQAVMKLKDLKELYHYFESRFKTRHDRKWFRKRFISEDSFLESLIQETIDYYEGKHQQE